MGEMREVQLCAKKGRRVKKTIGVSENIIMNHSVGSTLKIIKCVSGYINIHMQFK